MPASKRPFVVARGDASTASATTDRAGRRRAQEPESAVTADEAVIESQTSGRERISEEHNTIMALHESGGVVGVAAFDRLCDSIQVMHFCDNASAHPSMSYPMIQLAKLQLTPGVIYVSSKADSRLLQACRRTLNGILPTDQDLPADQDLDSELIDSGADHQARECYVKQERASLFHPHQGMLRIGSLLVHGMPSTAVTQQDRLKYLGTLVNLESSALVSALGALLNVMQTRGVACSHLAGEDEQVSDAFRGPTHVQMLKEVPLHGGLVLDNATLKGLQIFVNEQHPSNMGIGKAKEGFSIYGMFFSHAQTGMGKRLLRSWLLRPIVNAAVINDRQNAVELLVKSPDVLAELKTTLKKIHDVPRLVQRLSFVGKPDLALFRMLSSSLQQLLLLRSTILSLAPDVDSCAITQQVTDEAHAHLSTHVGWGAVSISHKLLAHILPELQACQDLIESVIDFELGADREADMLIRYDVCNELDNLKDVYFGLPDLLTKVLEAELQRVPSFLAQDNTKQLWSIVYLPLCGFVMQISGEPLTDDLLMELSDYTLAMEGHADDGAPSAYYHTDTTRSLNDQVGDVLYKIKDLEGSLCCELSRRLLSYSTQLHLASAVVAELDCLMAFAACASDHNYCRPELSAENVLHIEGGRHPLAELVVSSFIPNATCMPATQPRVHVISGPNASGKSCYIKQILCMLKSSTERSILVVDEFGKGTCAADGEGLLAAFLNHYTGMQHPPRCLVATHFVELFNTSVLPRSPQLAFYMMDATTASKNDDGLMCDPDHGEWETTFLYRLVQGQQSPSFGIHCAKMCGLPGDVLQRAHQVVASQQLGVALPTVPSSDAASTRHDELVQRLRQLNLQSCSWQTSAGILLHDVAGSASK